MSDDQTPPYEPPADYDPTTCGLHAQWVRDTLAFARYWRRHPHAFVPCRDCPACGRCYQCGEALHGAPHAS